MNRFVEMINSLPLPARRVIRLALKAFMVLGVVIIFLWMLAQFSGLYGAGFLALVLAVLSTGVVLWLSAQMLPSTK